jgi:hypothetical protein
LLAKEEGLRVEEKGKESKRKVEFFFKKNKNLVNVKN